jgi:hypothetical protein
MPLELQRFEPAEWGCPTTFRDERWQAALQAHLDACERWYADHGTDAFSVLMNSLDGPA